MALTNKQRAFIAEYLKDFNATQAALRVGYSPKTACAIGWENLRKPEIAEAIKQSLSENAMTAEEVLGRLADIARGDIADLMALSTAGFEFELATNDDNGNLIPNPKTKLIKKIKQKVTTIIGKNTSDEDREIIETELELYDAKSALDTLAKYHNLLIDRTDVTSGGKPIQNTGDNVGLDRAVSTLADAIREAVSRPDAGGASSVDAAKQAPVVSSPEQG